MSAVVVATGYGGPEVLSLVDQPTPQPGPGEVRIAVRAAGVNPWDYKVYSGMVGADPARLPLRIGGEASGVVSAVGPGAIGAAGPLAIGDDVVAQPVVGAYAAELVTAAAELLPKPAAVPFDQAAALLLTATTAVHALEATAVRSGDTVLVHGATGGVGLPAVQLAAQRGATVVATASPARHDLLRDLGAIPVAYGPGLADRVRAVAPGGVDAALDLVGTDEAIDTSLELVTDRQRIVSIAAFGRGPGLGIRLIGSGPGADPGVELRLAARPGLLAAVAEGRLRVIIGRSYPLADAAAAHREIMAGHTTGKIVLIP